MILSKAPKQADTVQNVRRDPQAWSLSLSLQREKKKDQLYLGKYQIKKMLCIFEEKQRRKHENFREEEMVELKKKDYKNISSVPDP
jgi:hypothetical protein